MYLLPEQTITPNTIHHMEASRFINCLSDDSVDLVVTSPPYDNLRDYNGYSFPFEDIARGLYRVLKSGGVLVWIVGDAVINNSESGQSFRQALYFIECGFNLHDTMIYCKPPNNPDKNRYYQSFEYMFVLCKDTPKSFNPIMRQNEYINDSITGGIRRADGSIAKQKFKPVKTISVDWNVWYFSPGYMKTTKDIDAYTHPAMFPEEICKRHIYTWSDAGDLVFDPFMGSGTTAKMAKALNRDYIGCDISREYVDLARDRVRNSDPFQASIDKKTGLKQLSLFG